MLKNINQFMNRCLMVYCCLCLLSCDSKQNQEQTLVLSHRLEALVFPVDEILTDTTQYEFLLYDSTLDYFIKRSLFDTTHTKNIFIEDVRVSGGKIDLTKDLFFDSIKYINGYCTAVELWIKTMDQDLLLATISRDPIDPTPFVIEHPGNLGIFKTGKLYIRLHYPHTWKSKRQFKWNVNFDVRYSYDGD